jgi:hypothetical protein
MMRARELPLVIVECCQRYVVSELHPVPRCHHCDEVPQYLTDTTWWLELSS